MLIHRVAGGGELEIEVCDDGAGAPGSGGAGHGLVGMRERVAVYGGSYTPDPSPAAASPLRARLPLRSSQS